MGMNFPDAPTLNQVFQNYTWDGEKWAYTAVPATAAPSGTNPIMDSVAAPGVANTYSRGDHVHPSDTSRIAKAGDTMTGSLTQTLNGHYKIDAGSGAGAGFWLDSITTGVDRIFVGSDSASPDTFRVYSVKAAGNLLSMTAGTTPANSNAVFSGSITAGMGSVTGTYYFGNAGTKYLTYDGTNFNLVGGGFIATGGSLNCSNVYSSGLFQSAQTANTGAYYFGNTGTKILHHDGTNFNFVGGSQVNASGAFQSAQTTVQGAYLFGSSGTKSLSFDGTNFNLTGGPLITSGTVYANGLVQSVVAPTTGAYYFGSTSTKYLNYDGTNFNLVGANFSVPGQISSTQPIQVPGYVTRTGLSGSYGANNFNIMHGTGQQLWIDATNCGTFAYTSDYRIKKDVIDLPGMWDTVKALRPIKYTQAQFSPPSHVKYIAEEALKARKEAEENPEAKPREVNTAPLYPADDIERWGFIAHELQETLTPSAATGVKDSPDTIQSPNPFTIIAALTKALQEAMVRIEALEAR